MIMVTIMKDAEMNSSMRRDYSTARSKIVLTTWDDRMYINAVSVLEWPRHITGFHIREARQAGDEKTWQQILRELSPTSSSFIRRTEVTIQSGQ
jgi:hypothetical protein